MSGVRLCNSRLQNDDAFKFYVNVFIHCENQSIVEAHMMVLAQHSPFCHRFFKSRKELKVADMFFTTMKHSVVEAAIILTCIGIVLGLFNQRPIPNIASIID